MAERTFSAISDYRSPYNSGTLSRQLNPKGSPEVTEWKFFRGNGAIKRVSGSKGGKFSPGDLKLRNFSVSTETYSAGSVSLSGKLRIYSTWGSPTSYKGMCRGTSGIGTDSLSGDLERVPAEARTTWDDQIARFTQDRCFAKFSAPDEDVGAFLGELPQTLRMLTSWVRGFKGAVREARKGGFTWARAERAWRRLRDGESLKKLPDRLSSSWLTWRYGIRPLFWDAQMWMKIASERAKRAPAGLRRKVARYSNSLDGAVRTSIRIPGDFGQYPAQISWTSEVKCETTCYYQILGEVSDLEWIVHKYGLHPTQVPALLWELTPLSFVVDWFVDVGTWIKALQPPIDVKVIGWSTSFRRDVRFVTAPVGKPDNWGTSRWAEPPTGDLPTDTGSLASLVRQTGTSKPGNIVPTIRPKIVLDVQKWMDLAALALQRGMPKH